FAGLAFAFSPYHIEKAMGHGNQTHMEFIALTFYFLVRWRQEARIRYAALAGVMAGLQLWMDYSLSYVLVFGLLAFFVVSALGPAFGKTWEDARLHGSSWIENSLFLGYVVIVLALVGLVLNRRRFPTALGIAIALVGAVMSEPPMAHILGVSFNTPSHYLYNF